MKIQELLKKLNEKGKKIIIHKFIIYADGSGCIKNSYDTIVCSFRKGENNMNKALTTFWDELNDETKQWEV